MKRPHQAMLMWVGAVAVLVAGGCKDESSADAVVQGTVTIDGMLAPRGQVTFHPVKSGPVATGPIHADGSFSLRIGQGNMANPDESRILSGEYVATVVVNEPADTSTTVGAGGPPLAGKRLTAIKYAQKDTSGLKYTVKPGRNVFPIDLEGSQNDPPPGVPAVEEAPATEEVPAAAEAPVEAEPATTEAAETPTAEETPAAEPAEQGDVDTGADEPVSTESAAEPTPPAEEVEGDVPGEEAAQQ